jgi:hypothetical protein
MPVSTLPSLSLNDYLSVAGLEKWLAELSVPDAPERRANLTRALRFLAHRMRSLPIGDAVLFLAAMDLSRHVGETLLPKGTRLVAFRTPTESPFKLFFAREGTAADDCGINTAGRQPIHYVVRTPAWALESFSSGVIDVWSPHDASMARYTSPRAARWSSRDLGVLAVGGAAQLIIPGSYAHLDVDVQKQAARWW